MQTTDNTVPLDREPDTMARTAGILAGITYVFVLAFAMISPGHDRDLTTLAIVGLIATVAVVTVAQLTTGWIRQGALTSLGSFLVVLPSFLIGGRSYQTGMQVLYFLRGGQETIMAFVLLATLLGAGGIAACESQPECKPVKWTTGTLATLGIVMQGIYGLALLTHATDWSRQLRDWLSSGGAMTMAAFIWVTVAIWVALILTLISTVKTQVRVASSGVVLSLVRIVMWSVIGFILQNFLGRLVGMDTGHTAPDVGQSLLNLFVVTLPLLVPFLVGSYLCVSHFGPGLLALTTEMNRPRRAAAPAPRPIKKPNQPAMPPQPEPARLHSAPDLQRLQKSDTDITTAFRRLRDLRDKTLISQEEFDAKKKELLDRV